MSAGEATLGWDRNPEPDVVNYTVYWGLQTGTYSWSADAGNVTTYTILNLQDGQRYFFAVQAVNSSGLRSPLSSEVSTTVAAATPVAPTTLEQWLQRFGLTDANADSDGDGLTNQAEFNAGTDPTLPNTLYLAEGSTGFFRERIALANPGTDPAEVSIALMSEAGATVVAQAYIPPQSRTSVTVNDIPGLEEVAVSAVITARRGGVVAERTMFWSTEAGEFYGGHTGKASPVLRNQWYFAEGFVGAFDTWFEVSNPNAAAAQLTVSYMLETGQVVRRSHSVGARTRLTVYANAVPELANRSFSTVIASNLPVTAERTMYFSALGQYWKGGTAAGGVHTPARAWYIAEGNTGPLFDEYVLIQNPNAAAATATIRFLRPGGTPIERSYVLPANSRTTIEVDAVPELTATDVSAMITASSPIVVERAMYWPAAAWYEGHASSGVTQAGTRWALAEGEHGGPARFDTYILLANPGTQDALVFVTVLREGAGPISHSITVPAHSRSTLRSSELGLASGEQFGAVVESLNGVPIVVERSMYWSTGALLWSGGTNETAVLLR